jgi:hypothetical protein
VPAPLFYQELGVMKHLLCLAIAAVLASSPAVNAKPRHSKDHAVRGCAPGLARKGCLPPGQAKKLYNVGHRFDRGFKGWTPYTQIPNELRIRYNLSPGGRYIYDQNYVYRVDPVTMVVSQVLTVVLQ